ncbi:MBL fold metallo-hydrolase [Bartonella sp. DGB1]|uniref:MBL fold metallo-hydrolase n=1 Tax=Bartonella sp. DGB1 TaxID=3239807 RepID=UPI003524D99A
MSLTLDKLKVIHIPVTPLRQNCTLLMDLDNDQAILVDPGGNGEKILKVIKENNANVKEIWITHCHFDHIGAANFVSEHLKINVVGPAIEDKLLLQYDVIDIARGYGIYDDTIQNVTIEKFLADGDIVTCGMYEFKVLHTPGHAPGHVIFFCEKLQFAIMGDVLFRGSIGRTDLIGSNHADLIRSLNNKVLPLGDNVQFICGHGPGSTILYERLHNPFLQVFNQ